MREEIERLVEKRIGSSVTDRSSEIAELRDIGGELLSEFSDLEILLIWEAYAESMCCGWYTPSKERIKDALFYVFKCLD